jgi:hypothetical protein
VSSSARGDPANAGGVLLARALQRSYELVWRLPPAGLRGAWRPLVLVIGLACIWSAISVLFASRRRRSSRSTGSNRPAKEAYFPPSPELLPKAERPGWTEGLTAQGLSQHGNGRLRSASRVGHPRWRGRSHTRKEPAGRCPSTAARGLTYLGLDVHRDTISAAVLGPRALSERRNAHHHLGRQQFESPTRSGQPSALLRRPGGRAIGSTRGWVGGALLHVVTLAVRVNTLTATLQTGLYCLATQERPASRGSISGTCHPILPGRAVREPAVARPRRRLAPQRQLAYQRS